MNIPWRIELLGWLRAQQGDVTVTRFRTRKTALLLARLALFPNRAHPREELADLFWPEADLEAGRNNLKQSLSVLRRLLEPPGTAAGSVLIADRQNVRLNPAAFSTDAAEFEAALHTQQWERAAALYRGELLPGFYDDWVIEERERLAALWEDAQLSRQDAPLPPSPLVSSSFLVSSSSQAAPSLPDGLPLPLFFTRFFGRSGERQEIVGYLQDTQTRLLTVTGPGGTGKTRLAVEIARQVAAEWENRVFFVSLADLSDPVLLPAAIADTLRPPQGTADEPLEQLVEALTSVPALLVLDNLEQIAEGSAPLLLSLLTRLPALTILATSRQRLYVAGEREYPLRPLETSETADSPERLLRFPGVQLFADRAQAARPDFQITPRNAAVVAEVCRRLEGIPLALELAAAWSSLLTPAQMRDRLEERFTLLKSRRKNVTERHQTLWAAVAWSYDLLPPDLARFWGRLSVFRAGFTAEAAQEVCEEEVCQEPRALDFLGQLRARSLVTVEDMGVEMRFRLLETLREFGGAQIGEDERRRLADSHAGYFMRLAEEAEPLLTGADQVQWLNRLGQEQDNLRAALDWDEAGGGSAERGLRTAGALWRFWAIRGPLGEGRRRLERALEQTGRGAGDGTVADARALSGLAVLVRRQGDMAAAGELQRRSLAIWRVDGDGRGIASSLNNLGTLATLQGNYAEAEPLLQESVALWRKLGKEGAVAQTLTNLAFLAREREDFKAAHEFCEESLRIARALGDRRGAALCLSIQAEVAAETGEYAHAYSFYAEVFATAVEIQDPQTVAGGLAVLGQIEAARNAPSRAARLLGASLALRDTFGSYGDARAQARALQAVDKVRRAIPPADFEAAWAEGQAMTAEEAVVYALAEPVP
jgi:predicted ATPase